MSEGNHDLAAILKGRVATYGFLSRLYKEAVDEAFLDEMCSMRFAVNTGDNDMDRGNRLLHSYLCKRWERTLTELAIDYARVFLGNGVNAYSAAYPYESVYTSRKRLLMQDARDEILAVFRAWGVAPSQDWKASEDHIALELEFEQTLGKRALEALNAGDEGEAARLLMASYDFLVDHLIAWYPMLHADIEKFAQTDFYKALAPLTNGFLTVDRELLEELLAEELDEVPSENREGSGDHRER
jgi:TorA maturation chaperone TorD